MAGFLYEIWTNKDGSFTVFSHFSRLFDDGFELASVPNIFDIGQCICCFVYPATRQYNFFYKLYSALYLHSTLSLRGILRKLKI